jgi:hypothetical protein
MLEYIASFLLSFFQNVSFIGVLLAFVFGAVWLACYRPPLFKQYWLWAVLAGSAFLTFLAIAFIQIPLQTWTISSMADMWGEDVVLQWALLAGIPNIVYTGLVQEGAKIVPVLIYRWRTENTIDPRLMLAVGAVAGAGFGIFETQWAHNSIIASGWTWDLVRSEGVIALAGFWERFFTIGFHTGASALVAYGLSKGKGVLFYFLAAIAHAVLNYSVLLVERGIFSFAFAEIYIAILSLIIAGITIWLRWRKQTVPGKGKKT